MAKITDKEYETLRDVSAEEILDAVHKTQNNVMDLIAGRKLDVREAYLKLPEPDIFPEGWEYRIRCRVEVGNLVLVTEKFPEIMDYYAFIKSDGRWQMTVEEYNRHIYKGAYV